MAYATTNPPRLQVCAFNDQTGQSNKWLYTSTDNAAAVRVSGYFTDGADLGMSVDDLVEVTDNDASPVTVTDHRVVSVSATGVVDLTDGDTRITGTNSD